MKIPFREDKFPKSLIKAFFLFNDLTPDPSPKQERGVLFPEYSTK